MSGGPSVRKSLGFHSLRVWWACCGAGVSGHFAQRFSLLMCLQWGTMEYSVWKEILSGHSTQKSKGTSPRSWEF